MVFHGTFAPLSVEEIRRMAHFDFLCTIGPRMRAIVDQAGMQDKMVDTGYLPFLHYPPRDADKKSALLSQLGMDPALPLVLYLPAGRPIGSWEFLTKPLIEQLPAHLFNLLLRPHPSHSVTARRSDRASFRQLRTLCQQRANTLLDLTTQDLSLLYACADLIISDGTSPAEESLFYDTPQLLVESPLYGYQQAKKVLLDKQIEQSHVNRVLDVYAVGGRLNAQSNDLLDAVVSAIEEQSFYASARLAYFEFVFGRSSRQLDRQQNILRQFEVYSSRF